MLRPMAEGGKWLRPPHDAPPVYIAPKQIEAHFKRLVGDGWLPCDDPRREGDQPKEQAVLAQVAPEVAMQARIDQLEALVRSLIAQKSEAGHAITTNDGGTHSEDPPNDSRSKRPK